MEIRNSTIRDMFRSRYPWAGEILVHDRTDWENPCFYVQVDDEGVWKSFEVSIKIRELDDDET